MDRRTFLGSTGKGILALSAFSAVTACGGVRRSDFTDRAENTIAGLDRDGAEILSLASLAPSGHNTQPWTVRIVEPGRWVIGTEKRRWLPAVDPENREMFLSIGAFLENLVIAAEALGYAVEVEVIAKGKMDTEVATIRLSRGKPTGFPIEKLKMRRTVRNNYLSREITPEDLKYVSKHGPCSATPSPPPSPHAYFFPKDSTQGKYLQEATIGANRTQASRDAAQEELANWIRWSNGDARRHRNGITPESMEITGIAGLYVRTFYNRKSVLGKGFREQTVDIVSKQVKAGGGWLVVSSPDADVSTLIQYGRMFENMLLKTRERMIAVQPMTQILEEDPWKGKIAKDIGVPGEIQWILRLGYLKSYPDPVSLRMRLSSILS